MPGMDISYWLNTLNREQQHAVTAPLGNLLVLAGAGSGKTRVLVHRVAWLIQNQGASPYSVLAVTFTNKAAGEMRGRLQSMIREIGGMWVGTFHGLSHKMLRLHWKEANLPEHFQVIDSDEQLFIIRKIFKSLNINEERFEPKKIQHFINRKKDEGQRAAQLASHFSVYDEVMKQVYGEYEKYCKDNGLLDFAELLLASYELLRDNESLRQHYQGRFVHFLVDEFQDTNTIQYSWLSLLAKGTAASVTVVGDDDQSIYGWRGAKIENLRRYEREFKDTQIIRLEQNYRSTETILSAANALISNNGSRLGKTLWTEGEKGELITVYNGFNEEDEALYIIRQIRGLISEGISPRDISILYRSNAQSRVLEEALVRAGLPYVIYGGLRFFERAEIKDALAYLRLAVNLNDNTAFERVINVPPRGIGDRSLEKIKEMAAHNDCSYWKATQTLLEQGLITGKIGNAAKAFLEFIEELHAAEAQAQPQGQGPLSLSQLMEIVLKNSGLLEYFKEQKGEKAQSRAENLEELLNATFDFEEEKPYEEECSPLTAFLAYTALESGERKVEKQENSIQLMTLHSAKGLEFPVVFICGLEEGLFPHHFSSENKEALEEERRLCYVGITRAMRRLFLSYADKRRLFGRDEDRHVSRFIQEIPEHLIQETKRKITLNNYSMSLFKKTPPKATMFEAEMDGDFCIGQRVSHPKFGEGTIVDQEGYGERARVHVKFDAFGSKWLALSFAKLEAVE